MTETAHSPGESGGTQESGGPEQPGGTEQPAEPARPRPAVMQTLEAVQILSDSMDQMHNSLKSSMGMNPSDLAALRMLVIRERQGVHVSPHDVARHLGISTASVTALVDRLSEAGHLRRRPHPQDRRSRVIELTPLARESFLAHFSGHLRSMGQVIEARDADELQVITSFLHDLAEAMESPLDAPESSDEETATETQTTPEEDTP